MKHFDYKTAAKAARLAPSQLGRLCREIRQEFPHDDAQFELHVLRTCMALRDGKITLQEALRVPATRI